MGADAITTGAAEHGMAMCAGSELAVKVATHAALDGAGLAIEHGYTGHKKESDAHKAFMAAGTFQAVADAKAQEAGYGTQPYNPYGAQPYNPYGYAAAGPSYTQPSYDPSYGQIPPPPYSATGAPVPVGDFKSAIDSGFPHPYGAAPSPHDGQQFYDPATGTWLSGTPSTAPPPQQFHQQPGDSSRALESNSVPQTPHAQYAPAPAAPAVTQGDQQDQQYTPSLPQAHTQPQTQQSDQTQVTPQHTAPQPSSQGPFITSWQDPYDMQAMSQALSPAATGPAPQPPHPELAAQQAAPLATSPGTSDSQTNPPTTMASNSQPDGQPPLSRTNSLQPVATGPGTPIIHAPRPTAAQALASLARYDLQSSPSPHQGQLPQPMPQATPAPQYSSAPPSGPCTHAHHPSGVVSPLSMYSHATPGPAYGYVPTPPSGPALPVDHSSGQGMPSPPSAFQAPPEQYQQIESYQQATHPPQPEQQHQQHQQHLQHQPQHSHHQQQPQQPQQQYQPQPWSQGAQPPPGHYPQQQFQPAQQHFLSQQQPLMYNQPYATTPPTSTPPHQAYNPQQPQPAQSSQAYQQAPVCTPPAPYHGQSGYASGPPPNANLYSAPQPPQQWNGQPQWPRPIAPYTPAATPASQNPAPMSQGGGYFPQQA